MVVERSPGGDIEMLLPGQSVPGGFCCRTWVSPLTPWTTSSTRVPPRLRSRPLTCPGCKCRPLLQLLRIRTAAAMLRRRRRKRMTTIQRQQLYCNYFSCAAVDAAAPAASAGTATAATAGTDTAATATSRLVGPPTPRTRLGLA